MGPSERDCIFVFKKLFGYSIVWSIKYAFIAWIRVCSRILSIWWLSDWHLCILAYQPPKWLNVPCQLTVLFTVWFNVALSLNRPVTLYRLIDFPVEVPSRMYFQKLMSSHFWNSKKNEKIIYICWVSLFKRKLGFFVFVPQITWMSVLYLQVSEWSVTLANNSFQCGYKKRTIFALESYLLSNQRISLPLRAINLFFLLTSFTIRVWNCTSALFLKERNNNTQHGLLFSIKHGC